MPDPCKKVSARRWPQQPVAVSAVLSGNRNFANRVHPAIPANFLASPALVVAYALAGTTTRDLSAEKLGTRRDGTDVFLAELWPGAAEVEATLQAAVSPEAFQPAREEREGWGDIDRPRIARPLDAGSQHRAPPAAARPDRRRSRRHRARAAHPRPCSATT